MQKRTNPLELKVDAKDYTPAPASPKKEASAAVPQSSAAPAPKTPEVVHTPKEGIPTELPVSEPIAPVAAEKTVSAPVAEKVAPTAEPIVEQEEAAEVEQPAPAPVAPVQEEESKAAAEKPARQKKETAAAPVEEDHVAPVRPGRPAPPRPVRHNSAEDRVRHGENIADNDVSVAVRFRVAGDRVDRKMVLARVSKDVCKLAQALYPEQSLGSIIEGALLTRAFLQDRDAFDEAAREIIKKGGKIKC